MEQLRTEVERLRGRLDRLNDVTGPDRSREGDVAIGDCYGSLARLESLADRVANDGGTGVHRRPPSVPPVAEVCPGCGARLQPGQPRECALHAPSD